MTYVTATQVRFSVGVFSSAMVSWSVIQYIYPISKHKISNYTYIYIPNIV